MRSTDSPWLLFDYLSDLQHSACSMVAKMDKMVSLAA
jgi:hypothetical protein